MSPLETGLVKAGMPPISAEDPPVSRFEFWPAWAFYAPIWVWIGLLAIRYRGLRLPLLVNPGFPAGGLVGEAKSELFARFSGPERKHLPDYLRIERRRGSAVNQLPDIEARLAEADLDYPLVAKPDIGCRGAGVRPIRSLCDLHRYYCDFPVGAAFLLQRMVEVEGEAGVFYVREPGAETGQIVSLTLKYFPRVVGDGTATLRQLIMADRRAGCVPLLYLGRFANELERVVPDGEERRLVFSGSHSKGAIFRNGAAYITEAMRARFDAIAADIDGFQFGRFDVRFADFEAFQRGEDFAIIEFNGAGAEATHVWDSRTGLLEAWRAIAEQVSTLFRIGAANRKAGMKPAGWRHFIQLWQQERSLVRRYPSTE